MKRHFCSYLSMFAGVYVLLALIVLLNIIFLIRTDELGGINAIVDKQVKGGGLYSGHHGVIDVKFENYKRKKPKIIALGSSRSLQIRDYFFTEPFYNIGGEARSLLQAYHILDRFFGVHKPEVVILYLDYWWRFSNEDKRPPVNPNYMRRTVTSAVAPIAALLDNRLQIGQYFDIISGKLTYTGPIQRIGFGALTTLGGFGPDGSHYYNLQGNMLPVNQRISDKTRFIRDEPVPSGRLDFGLLRHLQAELKQQGITLISILAPLSQKTLKLARQKKGYSYITELRRHLVEDVPNAYDFFDLSPYGASDCEFSDSMHAGEVANMRIIYEISKSENSPLLRYVDPKSLKSMISKHANGVTIANNAIGDAFRASINQQYDEC
ncbi:hypothetical protein [Gimesia sp.]|uniref:hypothetical protein n=1 Tax=Gimesia sp. TaxID=2024833 RepID=UPI003A8D7912